VKLSGGPNPSVGIEKVSITPGAPKDECFGALFDNCLFTPAQVFDGSTVQNRKLCFVGDDGTYESVYAISAPGRRPGYAVFMASTGASGEGSAWVDVVWGSETPSCTDARD
jgi:hypothetical protein